MEKLSEKVLEKINGQEKKSEGLEEKSVRLEKKCEELNKSYKRHSGKYRTSGRRMSMNKLARLRRQREKEEKLSHSASKAEECIERLENVNQESHENGDFLFNNTSNGNEDNQVSDCKEILLQPELSRVEKGTDDEECHRGNENSQKTEEIIEEIEIVVEEEEFESENHQTSERILLQTYASEAEGKEIITFEKILEENEISKDTTKEDGDFAVEAKKENEVYKEEKKENNELQEPVKEQLQAMLEEEEIEEIEEIVEIEEIEEIVEMEEIDEIEEIITEEIVADGEKDLEKKSKENCKANKFKNVKILDEFATKEREISMMSHVISQTLKKVVEENNHKKGCQNMMWKIVSRYGKGLKTKYDLQCNECGALVSIWSEPQSEDYLDINLGSALGTITAGIGYSTIEEALAAINVHYMSPAMYIKNRFQIGLQLIDINKSVMKAAAKKEAEIAIAKGHVINGVPYITVVVDCAWCKRSYRTSAYDALGGCVLIIGYETNKIIDCIVRNIPCATCQRAMKEEREPKEHECFSNYDESKSSSSMEPEMVVEGFMTSEDKYGLIYKYRIGDGDSSTDAMLASHDPYEKHNVVVKKLECNNHKFRNFGNPNLKSDNVIPVQVTKQPDDTSCGVYAGAFAMSLCLNEEPSAQDYSADSVEMRQYFFDMIQYKEITPFPLKYEDIIDIIDE